MAVVILGGLATSTILYVFLLPAIYLIRTSARALTGGRVWLPWALLSAVAAALTAILAKIGVAGVPSTTATAMDRVVLVLAWGLVFAAGEHRSLRNLPPRSITFLIWSGLATGVSWLAYFRALQAAPRRGWPRSTS